MAYSHRRTAFAQAWAVFNAKIALEGPVSFSISGAS